MRCLDDFTYGKIYTHAKAHRYGRGRVWYKRQSAAEPVEVRGRPAASEAHWRPGGAHRSWSRGNDSNTELHWGGSVGSGRKTNTIMHNCTLNWYTQASYTGTIGHKITTS